MAPTKIATAARSNAAAPQFCNVVSLPHLHNIYFVGHFGQHKDNYFTCPIFKVSAAQQMLNASLEAAADADIFIAAAAVADYRASSVAEQKIKKQGEQISISLEKNPDIVATVAQQTDCFVVGFAAETQDVESYARDKLARKNLHAIIANDVSRGDVGFNAEDNEVSWIDADSTKVFSKRSKAQLARDILEHMVNHHKL